MTPDLELINASDGNGEAVKASVTQIRAANSTTLKVDSILNWPAKFIATTGTLLPDNTLDPSTVLVFAGHLSGSDIVIDEIAPGYIDNGSSVADIVVLKPTTYWADNIQALLAVSFDTDGTFNSNGLDAIATGLATKEVRTKPRISVAESTATLTPNIDTDNIYELSAQAQALTIANPTGTPNDGDVLIIRLKDNGATRAITYGDAYVNISGLDNLTATVAGKWHVIGALWNAGVSKWQIVSITTEG